MTNLSGKHRLKREES